MQVEYLKIIYTLHFSFCIARFWLGWEDSNLRIQVPKTCVLPLDDTPNLLNQCQISKFKFQIKSKAKMSKKKEEWNDGTLEYWLIKKLLVFGIIPSLQHSIIPKYLFES